MKFFPILWISSECRLNSNVFFGRAKVSALRVIIKLEWLVTLKYTFSDCIDNVKGSEDYFQNECGLPLLNNPQSYEQNTLGGVTNSSTSSSDEWANFILCYNLILILIFIFIFVYFQIFGQLLYKERNIFFKRKKYTFYF